MAAVSVTSKGQVTNPKRVSEALDTNILVRYYVQGEPRQSAIATRIIAALRHAAYV